MKVRQTAKRSLSALLVLSGVAFCVPTAMAADPASHNAKFISLDKNRDGFLSKDEVAGIRDYEKPFNDADDNRDGRLSQDEFVKAEAMHDRARAADLAKDSVITAKVKAALLKARELKSLDVSVETYKGQVLLSGFVRNADQRDRAIKVASSVEGVTTVKDGLVVR